MFILAVPVSCINITVNKKDTILVETITLSPTDCFIYENEFVKIDATIFPTSAENPELRWTSADVGIASINSPGIIIGVSPGTTTVTVSSIDGGGAKATCRVTVTKMPVLATSIQMSQTSGSIVEGEKLKLFAIVSPPTYTMGLIWSSSDPPIATVSGDGMVTGVTPGSVTITAATIDGSNVKGTCEITVTNKVIPVWAVSINEHELTLKKGDTYQLVAVVSPDNATYPDIKWTSSKTDVATVDATGKVTAKASGTATITATSIDGTNLSASCAVTVKDF